MSRLGSALLAIATSFLVSGDVAAQTGSGPVSAEDARAREAFRVAREACARELGVNPSKAVDLCKAAVTAAEKLPPFPESDLTIGPDENALRSLLRSLVEGDQLSGAIETLKQLIGRRSASGRAANRRDALDFLQLGALQPRGGDPASADAAFSQADAIYAALIRDSPQETYLQEVYDALRVHEAFRRARGDTSGAEALSLKADAIVAPSPGPFVQLSRRVGDVTVVDSTRARISDEDVRQIQAALAPAGVLWVTGGTLSSLACLQPAVSTREIRRGQCVSLRVTAAEGGRRGGWAVERGGLVVPYFQLAGDASATPIQIFNSPDSPTLTDDALISLVSLIRGRAVASTTRRLTSDVQPWPIKDIMQITGGDVLVTLRNPVSVEESGLKAAQWVTLRPQNQGWIIVEMR
jgi:hypothetical protein